MTSGGFERHGYTTSKTRNKKRDILSEINRCNDTDEQSPVFHVERTGIRKETAKLA